MYFRALKAYQNSPRPPKTLVKGQRHGRRLSEKIVSLGMGAVATMIFRRRLSEINAQPKVFHRDLLAHLTRPPIDFNFDVYVLVVALRNGWQIGTIPVEFPPRQYGHSNWARTWRSKLRTIWRSAKYMVAEARRQSVEDVGRKSVVGSQGLEDVVVEPGDRSADKGSAERRSLAA